MKKRTLDASPRSIVDFLPALREQISHPAPQRPRAPVPLRLARGALFPAGQSGYTTRRNPVERSSIPMPRQLTVLVLALALVGARAHAAGPEPKTDDDKTMYALGVALSQNLENFSLSEQELELVKLGITDGGRKRDKKVPDIDSYGPKLQQLARTRMSNVAAAEKKAAEPFLEKAAAEKGAERTSSGLIYSELKAGTGEQPKSTDVVKVNYEGRLMDG